MLNKTPEVHVPLAETRQFRPQTDSRKVIVGGNSHPITVQRGTKERPYLPSLDLVQPTTFSPRLYTIALLIAIAAAGIYIYGQTESNPTQAQLNAAEEFYQHPEAIIAELTIGKDGTNTRRFPTVKEEELLRPNNPTGYLEPNTVIRSCIAVIGDDPKNNKRLSTWYACPPQTPKYLDSVRTARTIAQNPNDIFFIAGNNVKRIK